MNQHLFAVAAVFLVSCASRAASAQTQAGPGVAERWRISAEAQTRFPVSMGARLRLESPSRFRVAFDGGVVPLPYAASIDGILTAAVDVEGAFGGVFRELLTSAPVLRGTFGWRPWADTGWYVEAGYASVAFGGGIVNQQALDRLERIPPALRDALLEQVPPELQEAAFAALDYDINSTVHTLVLAFGYEWRLSSGLLMRWEVGYAGAIRADAEIVNAAGIRPTDPRVRDYVRDVELTLESSLTGYGHFPTVAFGLGYEFTGPASALD